MVSVQAEHEAVAENGVEEVVADLRAFYAIYLYVFMSCAAAGTCPEHVFAVVWKVLDILQHIQALDPSQHGAVGYLVQHTLEHIERRKEELGPEVKHRSDEKHKEVCFSIGLIMKHKR